jgi:hypothetical protein
VLDNLNNLTAQTYLEKAVVAVASELNIARRNWAAYPSGHPQVEISLNKMRTALQNLLQRQSPVQIGVTRDGLLLGEEFIGKGNLACCSVAAAFFERGAGTLLIRQEPRLEELQALLRLMSMKREEILAEGGIERVWEASAITFLEMRGIRYDRFSGTEETYITANSQDLDTSGSVNLWESFVRLMMQGEVGISVTDAAGDVTPEVLAESLNASYYMSIGTGNPLYSSKIRKSIDLMRKMIGTETASALTTDNQLEASSIHVAPPAVTLNRELHAFVANLDPALRRHILDGFFEFADDADSGLAEMLFRQLGPAMLQDTYANVEEFSSAPHLLQGILRKLLPHMTDVYKTSTPQDEIRDKVRILLQEHLQEAYIPDEYLLGLEDLLAEDQLQQFEKYELREMLTSVEPAAIEIRGSEIILQLVLTDPDGENAQELIQDLACMCDYFLELGDYGQVLKLLRQSADSRLVPHLRMALRDAFSRPEFLNEILSGLAVWGKPKYDQVTLLIRVIGKPFIEPLLDRLAVEESMSLRRFIMDRLLAFGDAARPALVARLDDQRWYVLRNIIGMLRTLAPGQEADRLRSLLKHTNQKVRNEALISLLLAGDSIAQRQLLRDLDSSNRETQLAAIHLVDKTGGLEMARKLADKLSTGGYSPLEYELKTACVKALAEIGRAEVLPELARVLKAYSLLAGKNLNRLKVDIVRSLERYPAEAALPILERFSSGSSTVAMQATESLKQLRGRVS